MKVTINLDQNEKPMYRYHSHEDQDVEIIEGENYITVVIAKYGRVITQRAHDIVMGLMEEQ